MVRFWGGRRPACAELRHSGALPMTETPQNRLNFYQREQTAKTPIRAVFAPTSRLGGDAAQGNPFKYEELGSTPASPLEFSGVGAHPRKSLGLLRSGGAPQRVPLKFEGWERRPASPFEI